MAHFFHLNGKRKCKNVFHEMDSPPILPDMNLPKINDNMNFNIDIEIYKNHFLCVGVL